jgi:hypothetical protein
MRIAAVRMLAGITRKGSLATTSEFSTFSQGKVCFFRSQLRARRAKILLDVAAIRICTNNEDMQSSFMSPYGAPYNSEQSLTTAV